MNRLGLSVWPHHIDQHIIALFGPIRLILDSAMLCFQFLENLFIPYPDQSLLFRYIQLAQIRHADNMEIAH